MMDKSSRSPSVSSDIDDSLETASTKSNDVGSSKAKSVKNQTETQSSADQVSSDDNAGSIMKENESKLADNINRLESIIQSLRDSTTAQISQLRDMVTQKDKVILDLKEKLDLQRDYEEIKRELSFVRNGISHFGSMTSGLDLVPDPKAIESYLLENSKAIKSESSKLDTNSSPAQQMVQRNPFFNHFALPQLSGLGNVDSFGTFLGEEIANSYAKALAKRDPSFLAMAAAVAANANNNNNSSSATNTTASSKLSANNNQNNNGNNSTDSLSPSHVLNGDENIEEKSIGSASTIPLSAMISSDVVDPLTHSPIGATNVSDLGINVSSYSPSAHNSSASYDKLQQQLRSNVEKYMNENLNTLQISRCVREYLSMHNIGQRLFAKYVLGLSQGTVSELLSKPKPWDKLTEKGRDSYRKMHAWATDNQCINLLKSLVPRKDIDFHLGKDSTAFKQEDPVAEERVAQILSEAQRSMKGVNRSDYFSSPFLSGEQLHSKMDRDMKTSALNDNTSDDVGSDRDEKSEHGTNERKSPSVMLNATAMATINNFNESLNDSRNKMSRAKYAADSDEQNQTPDLMRLYHLQLAKVFGQQVDDGFRNYDDIRSVIALQQELSRINPFPAQANNPELFARLFSSGLINGAGYLGGLPLGLESLQHTNHLEHSRKSSQLDSHQSRDNRDSALNEPRLKIDNLLSQLKSDSASPSQNGTSSGNTSANSVLNNGDLSAPDDMAASPLQRMQSITNSLLSQSSLPSLPSQPPRPAKAVLPPITQQQFDQYNNLNTEDIVKRVKEQLSQYSISQRLFGESVLGLSQGSVSDLLARPKPWHMLTQKGREPFIRMKMFLEDENAIHKLVASQYKIAPEKLMRTGNFVAGTGIANMTMTSSAVPQVPTPPATLSLGSTNANSKSSHLKSGSDFSIKYEQSMSPNSTDNGGRSNTSTPEINLTNSTSSPSPLSVRSRMSGYAGLSNNLLRPNLSQTSNYMQPSVYELAALTSDLDTQTITTRIKETLMAHNIGQKIFGEVVLGLSQGSVSELLSKPKPWHMLSIKGREPFIRMQLWLNDPNNIEKLQALKNERREANKRRRTHMDEGLAYKSIDNQLFNFSNNFNMANSLGKGLLNTTGVFPLSATNQQPAVKKSRILFTEQQKEALRIAFAMDPYPSSTTAEFLAKELDLSIRTITNWFHNHRMRLKQINSSSNGDESNQTPLPYNSGRDNVSFDQNQFRTLLAQRIAELKLNPSNTNSNNSSNGSSNQFGAFNANSSASPQHRFKYSSSMYQTQSLYSNNTNSCSSPGSSSPFHEEEEMGTLDLSMTSHNQQLRHRSSDKLDSTGRSSVQDYSDDGCRTDEDDDEQAISDDENRKGSLDLSSKKYAGSSRRKPQHVMSSSSRRKAAQPQQWVAPVDPTIYGEDDYAEDDYEDDREMVGDDLTTHRRSPNVNLSAHKEQRSNKRSNEDEDNDDQKTDEETEDREQIDAESDAGNMSPPPYKKLKSSASVMSKLAINDDSSNIIQECVQ